MVIAYEFYHSFVILPIVTQITIVVCQQQLSSGINTQHVFTQNSNCDMTTYRNKKTASIGIQLRRDKITIFKKI